MEKAGNVICQSYLIMTTGEKQFIIWHKECLYCPEEFSLITTLFLCKAHVKQKAANKKLKSCALQAKSEGLILVSHDQTIPTKVCRMCNN